MYPILFRIGRLEIHSYGLLLAISFLIGIYWSMFRAQKRGIERNAVMDLSLILVVCAIVGSRFLYVVTHLHEFKGRWLDTFNPFQSTGEIGIMGLTMLGGVVLSLIAIVVFCRVKNINFLRLCDVFAPAVGLGIFLTRIGCFLHGCCFGKPCDLPWGVVFPLFSPAGSVMQGITIHPTQIYSSLYGLAIMFIILLLDRKPRFDGFLLSVFFMLYGIARFFIDYVRYYEESVKVGVLGASFTINQVISFLMFGAGLVLLFLLRRRAQGGAKKP